MAYVNVYTWEPQRNVNFFLYFYAVCECVCVCRKLHKEANCTHSNAKRFTKIFIYPSYITYAIYGRLYCHINATVACYSWIIALYVLRTNLLLRPVPHHHYHHIYDVSSSHSLPDLRLLFVGWSRWNANHFFCSFG